MAEHDVPNVFSFDFHFRFFPGVLARRLRPRREETQSPFAHHLPLELPIALIICLCLAAYGLSRAFQRGSALGGVVGALGLIGASALVVQSVRAEVGTPATFAAFRVAVFCFFVTLGATLGIALGTTSHSRAIEAIAGASGLMLGYTLGIAGGLWVQYLGWIAGFVELAAGLATIGVIVVGLVLLFG